MPRATSALGIDCDVFELLTTAYLFHPRGPFNDRWFDKGVARCISCQGVGVVFSACYHATKWHSVRVQTGIRPFIHEERCEAPPGQWAIAWLPSDGLESSSYKF